MVYGAAVAFLAVVGGTMSVELPADKKVAELEYQYSMNLQQQRDTYHQQQVYHYTRELESIRWRMQYVTNEINRINQIPQYLKRRLTPEEAWQIEQLKEEWQLLRQREDQLMKAMTRG